MTGNEHFFVVVVGWIWVVHPAGFGPDTLYPYPEQLHDPDDCADIVMSWVYDGVSFDPSHKLLRFQDERNRQIVQRYEAGESRAAIAAAFGISVRRVGYIIQEAKRR